MEEIPNANFVLDLDGTKICRQSLAISLGVGFVTAGLTWMATGTIKRATFNQVKLMVEPD